MGSDGVGQRCIGFEFEIPLLLDLQLMYIVMRNRLCKLSIGQ